MEGEVIAHRVNYRDTRVVVSVVVVGYNSEAAFAEYFAGFASSFSPKFEIVLVDNGSSDRTVEKFQELFPSGRVIEAGENLGFARAVNLGVAVTRGEWILLLNPDAAVKTSDITALYESVMKRSACAIVGPLVESGGNVIPAGRFPSVWRMFVHATALSTLARASKVFEGHYIRVKAIERGLRQVDWVTGGCMLVRRSAWSAAGGLTERWFMYGEDLDLCYRLKKHGYEIFLNQDVTVFHGIGRSSSGIDGQVSTVWLEHLFEFYSSSIATNTIAKLMWQSVVFFGFFGRSLLFSCLARLGGGQETERNAMRFRVYASAVRPSFAVIGNRR